MTSISHRAQVEPLAALVSVAALCVALSVYAGVTTTLLDRSGTDRDVATPALDSAWISLQSNGVIKPTRTPFQDAIDTQTLPQGRYIRVSVTVVTDSGRLKTIDNVTITPRGTIETTDRTQAPAEATIAERPVPVRVDSGDVRPGRLTVEVWR